jgi:hypothetical protein
MSNPSESSAPGLTGHEAKTPTDLKSGLFKGRFPTSSQLLINQVVREINL